MSLSQEENDEKVKREEGKRWMNKQKSAGIYDQQIRCWEDTEQVTWWQTARDKTQKVLIQAEVQQQNTKQNRMNTDEPIKSEGKTQM